MLAKALALSLLSTAVAFGAVIYDSGVTSLAGSLSTQGGRLSRSTINGGIPSDWATPVTFPGVVNPAVSYRYAAFSIPSSPYAYLQISFYDELGASNTFASAYENAYLPTGRGTNLGLDTNYLGYAGNSGNVFGNPRAFQVILPNPSVNNLVVVVNETSGVGAGINQPFEFIVEGFYDTNFDDAPAAPEPASLLLSGSTLAAGVLLVFARRRRSSSRTLLPADCDQALVIEG